MTAGHHQNVLLVLGATPIVPEIKGIEALAANMRRLNEVFESAAFQELVSRAHRREITLDQYQMELNKLCQGDR